MDRRTLLAIALCFGVFVAWQKFYIEPHTLNTSVTQNSGAQALQQQAPSTSEATPSTAPQNIIAPSTQTPGTPARHAPQSKILHTATGDAVIGDNGRFFTAWTLKNYKK